MQERISIKATITLKEEEPVLLFLSISIDSADNVNKIFKAFYTYEQLPSFITKKLPKKHQMKHPFSKPIKLTQKEVKMVMEKIHQLNEEMIKFNMNYRRTQETRKETRRLFVMFFLKQVLLYRRTKKEMYYLNLDGNQLVEKSRQKSLNDDFQRIPRQNVKKVGKKVKEMKGISNFTLISNNDKGFINKTRIGMLSMLYPMNRADARWDFIRLSAESSDQVIEELKNVKEGVIIKETDEKYKNSLKCFIREYPKFRDSESCLNWYTKASFFNRVMNKGLRVLSSIKETCYLRLPFSDLFFSIKEEYQKQKDLQFREKKHFTCFRGAYLPAEEAKILQSNIDGYIQMEGFMSTSLSYDKISNFIDNVLIEVTVFKDDLGGELDNGFALLTEISEFAKENEVLFNAMNMFKVTYINWETHKIIINKFDDRYNYDKELWMVKLEYNPMRKFLERNEKNEWLSKDEKEIVQNYEYFMFLKELKIKTSLFGFLGFYKQSIELFYESLKLIRNRKLMYPLQFDNDVSKKEEILIVFQIGELHHYLNESDKALKKFLEVDKNYQLKEKKCLYLYIGSQYHLQNDSKNALLYFSKAKRLKNTKKLCNSSLNRIVAIIEKIYEVDEQVNLFEELLYKKSNEVGIFHLGYLEIYQNFVALLLEKSDYQQLSRAKDTFLFIGEKAPHLRSNMIYKFLLLFFLRVSKINSLFFSTSKEQSKFLLAQYFKIPIYQHTMYTPYSLMKETQIFCQILTHCHIQNEWALYSRVLQYCSWFVNEQIKEKLQITNVLVLQKETTEYLKEIVKKYPIYMWTLVISGELERKKNFKLCICYFMKMLDIFQNILLEEKLYVTRFQVIIYFFRMKKKDRKWMRRNKQRLLEKINRYVYGKTEDFLKKLELMRNGFHLLASFAQVLNLRAEAKRYRKNQSLIYLEKEKFALQRKNYHKQLSELQKKTIFLHRRDYIFLFNPYNQIKCCRLFEVIKDYIHLYNLSQALEHEILTLFQYKFKNPGIFYELFRYLNGMTVLHLPKQSIYQMFVNILIFFQFKQDQLKMIEQFGFSLQEEVFYFVKKLFILMKKFHNHNLTSVKDFNQKFIKKGGEFAVIKMYIKILYQFEFLNFYEIKEILETMKVLLQNKIEKEKLVVITMDLMEVVEKMGLLDDNHYIKWMQIREEAFWLIEELLQRVI